MFTWDDVLVNADLPALLAATGVVMAVLLVAAVRPATLRRRLPPQLGQRTPGAVEAWKVSRLAWGQDGTVVLTGLTRGTTRTSPLRGATAHCCHAPHRAPRRDCECGFWAVYDRDRARALAARPFWRHPGNVVVLRVALSGAAVVGPRGVRASRQDVLTLQLPPCTVCGTGRASSVAVRPDRPDPVTVWGFCGCDRDALLRTVSTHRGYAAGPRFRWDPLAACRRRALPCRGLRLLPASRLAAVLPCEVTLADGTPVTPDRAERITGDAIRWLDATLRQPLPALRPQVRAIASALDAAGAVGAERLTTYLGDVTAETFQDAPATGWELLLLLDLERRARLLTTPGADHWRRAAGVTLTDFDGYLAAMTVYHGPPAVGLLRWWVTLPPPLRDAVPLRELPGVLDVTALDRLHEPTVLAGLPPGERARLLAALRATAADDTGSFAAP